MCMCVLWAIGAKEDDQAYVYGVRRNQFQLYDNRRMYAATYTLRSKAQLRFNLYKFIRVFSVSIRVGYVTQTS